MRAHTCIHAYMNSYIQLHTYTLTLSHIHTYIHTFTLLLTYTYTRSELAEDGVDYRQRKVKKRKVILALEEAEESFSLSYVQRAFLVLMLGTAALGFGHASQDIVEFNR